MTYADKSTTTGAEPFQWVEFEVERCTLTHGTFPCTATGSDKCFNSIATCQAPNAFDAEPYWLRMCEPRAAVPLQFPFTDDGAPFFWPLLRNVRHTPVKVDPGKSIGVRAEVRITLEDAPHHDTYVDPYVSSRSYDPLLNGSFLQKLRARFPYSLGRRLRWYEGFLPEGLEDGETVWPSPALDDFVRREYVIEKIEGPDRRGRVTIVAKDPLKLADNDRAQDPVATSGVLAFDLESDATITHLDIVTTEPEQYPSGGGYVFLGSEGMTYTGREVPPDAGENVHRLTGVTRSLPDGYETERSSHDAGDTVQLASYRQGKVVEVVRDLLLDRVPGFRAEWVDFSEWEAEYDTWLSGLEIRRMIHEPEGVHDLLDEITEQTLTWGFWWDEAASRVRYRAMRPVDITETVTPVNDDQNLVAGSVDRADDPDALINEVRVLYGQRDPTEKRDDTPNYRRGLFRADVDSQSETGDNVTRIETIYARWHSVENRSRVEQFVRRTLSSKAVVPVQIEFEMAFKDRPDLADFLDMTSIWIVNEFGLPRSIRLRVLRKTLRDDTIKYEAREDFFKTKFGRWAPDSLNGLTWALATQEQKDRYLFWTSPTGFRADGTKGNQWL